ncbi:MAG: shikimate kinase [Pirellulales bacterium]
MLVALIGYRGTGKTTVARLLALRLGWSWRDADIELERRAGRTIAEIFACDGEGTFRDLESDVLADLTRLDRAVLALGGGVVLRQENRNLLAGATLVWLAASAETIQERLAADPATGSQRPNLTIDGGLTEIRAKLDDRRELYRQSADLAVDTESKTPDQIVAEILVRLPELGGPIV